MLDIDKIVAEMPKIQELYDNDYNPIEPVGIINQCRLLAEAGYRKPIEPIPQHCSEHRSFQDDCQGCQGVTSQYKYIRPGIPNKYNAGNGEYKEIDWGSFHLGQEMMLDQGYRKVPSGDEIGTMLIHIPDNVGVGDYINHWLLERNNE